MTMKQIQNTMDVIRNACTSKHPKLDLDIRDNVKNGQFVDDNKDLRCYTLCVADMAGALNRKKQLDYQKIMQQIDTMLPTEMRAATKVVVETCKNVKEGYKDNCDKAYFTTKCAYETDSSVFLFP
ncbi:general odorant-binding protein 72-like isoform X2 [Phlebotomus argentipes]|nr:general odorant-binding protein 72-like isoform X2 [Phlebotomus argentipes]